MVSIKVNAEVSSHYTDCEAVITQGFVSATEDGEPTVLGRGGSDYTASLIGMAVGAQRIEIWTDVDGVKTADPRKVEGTQSLERISFEEAAEMAHFGAKVLHPMTIEPAVKKNIPLRAEFHKSGRQGNCNSSEFVYRRRCEIRVQQGEHIGNQHLLYEDDQCCRLPYERV